MAAFLSWHEHHERARRALVQDIRAVPMRVVAEVFSVLTRLPAPHRIAPQSAIAHVERLRGPFFELPGDQLLPLLTTQALPTKGPQVLL